MTEVENLFTTLDNTAIILETELQVPYLEALAMAAENIFQSEIIQDVSELTKKQLEKEYKKVTIQAMEKEQIRKGFQLAVLKGMQKYTQPNHQMTPDAVSVFIGYLVSRFTENNKTVSILDPVVGAGNLLTTVLNHVDKETMSYGVDIDDTLLKLSYASANLQQYTTRFFNQDTLRPLLVNEVDVVVADLPIGYYPDDDNADTYELKANEGHSYTHHLIIEQSLRYAKEGAYLFFLIPNTLFSSTYAKELNEFLKTKVEIQCLFQLPLSMFKKEDAMKSIFVVQKKGFQINSPKKALLVDLPSFSNKSALEQVITQINGWFTEIKKVF